MNKALTFIAIFVLSNPIFAQSEDEKAVKAVVVQLFDSMQKHDSTMIRACFHPTARIQSMGENRETGLNEIVTENSVDGFVKSIGSLPATVQIEEREISSEIRIDNQLATAWTKYEFYNNKKVSHCGYDAFQFYKTEKGWKILSIVYTRRKCD